MEEATIIVANQFGKDLGFGEDKFNIDATPEGITYYFLQEDKTESLEGEGADSKVAQEDASLEDENSKRYRDWETISNQIGRAHV